MVYSLLLDWNIIGLISTGCLVSCCERRLQLCNAAEIFLGRLSSTAYFFSVFRPKFSVKVKRSELDCFRYVLFYYHVVYLCSVSTINQILPLSAFVDYYDESTADERSRPC